MTEDERAAYIKALVDSAPPPTPEQVETITRILRPRPNPSLDK